MKWKMAYIRYDENNKSAVAFISEDAFEKVM